MSRRQLTIVISVAGALALGLLLTLRFKQQGSVQIGSYPTLSAKAKEALSKLPDLLGSAEKLAAIDLSDNADLKTNYLDPLEKMGNGPDAPKEFTLLMETLQWENKATAAQGEFNRSSLQTLSAVSVKLLSGGRYEELDPALVALEGSFTEQDSLVSALSDRQTSIPALLQILQLSGVSHVDDIRTMCDRQANYGEHVSEQYSKTIKVVAKTLRDIVDDMAAQRSKSSAPEKQD